MDDDADKPSATLFRAYAAAVLLGSAGMAWLPENASVLDTLYLTLLLSSFVATAFAVRRSEGDRLVRRGWAVLATGLLLYFGGDVTWVWYARTGRDPYPSLADAMFITGTLVMIAGAYVLSRRITGQLDRWTQLDVALLAIAVGAVVWTQSVLPYVDGVDILSAEGLITAAYPVLDVLLTGTVARLLISSGRSTPAMRLLLATLALLTVVDVIYYRQELAGTYVEFGLLDAGFALSVCGVAVAALHPSAFDRMEIGGRQMQLTGARLSMLVAASMTPLLLLGLATALDLPGQGPVLAVVGAVSVGLLTWRTWVLIGVSREVVELRHARQLSGMIRNTSDALLVLDDDDRLVYASPALTARWSLDPDDLVGRPVHELLRTDDRDDLVAWLAAVRDASSTHGHHALETGLVDGTGVARAVHVTASSLDEPIAGGRLLLTARDISDRVALEDELRIRAECDSLTGLANRAAFMTMLERTIEQGAAAAVLFIDVDDFKDVNDVMGHDVGDELLRMLATRLTSSVRPGDGVARLGGDEFGAVLTGRIGSEAVAAVCARVVDQLCVTLDVNGRVVRTSVSVGSAAVDPGDEPVEVLRRADLAMYSAKRSGKAKMATFDARLAQEARRDHDLRSRLRDAVPSGEMWLAYQPIVEVDASHRLVGHEALLRWDLDGQPVRPDEFIPVAESTGDIVDIGAWVVQQACVETAALLGRDDDGPFVSVNVSAVQLEDDSFAETVAEALRASGLPPHRLELELTESVMADEVSANSFIELRSLGVRLAIDDFGTGWCSLSYLQRFPVDVVKVDRAFAVGIVERPGLLDGIAQLIEATGAVCLMEGIEDERQYEVVRSLGISRGQGWLFGKPAPLDDVLAASAQPG